MPVTNYLWDQQNYLAESDDGDVIQTVFTNEPQKYGNLISERQGSTSRYHHYDALGSTRQLTNAAGAVSDTWSYDAWGNEVARTGTTVTAMAWVGEVGYYWDSEVGGFWVRVRPVEPEIARWLSKDPSDFLDQLNLYVYTRNQPILGTDPSGRLTVTALKQKLNVDCGETASITWAFTLDKPAPCTGHFVQHVRTWCNTSPFCWDCKCRPASDEPPTFEFWEAFNLTKKGFRSVLDDSTVFCPNLSCGYSIKVGIIKYFCLDPEDDNENKVGTGPLGKSSGWISGKTFGAESDCPTNVGFALGKDPPAPDFWDKTPIEGPAIRIIAGAWACCPPFRQKPIVIAFPSNLSMALPN